MLLKLLNSPGFATGAAAPRLGKSDGWVLRSGSLFMKRYSKEDQRVLAKWAADCAERVLGIFEEACPGDGRPREAIEVCRRWAATGVFRMSEIRGASLGARAAGQAVATAHMVQHVFGGAYYALKAVAADEALHAEVRIAEERRWQERRLAKNLRGEILKRIVVQKRGEGIFIKIEKGQGF
jgi:hypothetical protein